MKIAAFVFILSTAVLPAWAQAADCKMVINGKEINCIAPPETYNIDDKLVSFELKLDKASPDTVRAIAKHVQDSAK